MKVILKQDVPNLGQRGAAIEVSEGYARNYLIPRGLAAVASEGALKALAVEQKAAAARKAREEAEARALGERLAGLELVIPAKLGEGGRLFGSVTAKDIAAALETRGVKLDKRKLELAEPIKQLGTYQVPVKLHPKVHLNLAVKVVAG
ncbi:MAG TPA: 50S ribosomal protein L9 [Firmicutes bacterium]|nr:50S ribosomal protein L9 [Bacillota bacterium]